MSKNKRSIHVVAFLSAVITILSMTACARKEGPERVVATINDYKMTVEDFNYESKEILHTGRLLGEVPATKEDILDALIVKELLLQAAQEEDLDKDKLFMKTIELYWEQTLLKNLLMKKSKEIEKKVMAYENDISDYYSKMKHNIRAKILVFNDERSARRLLNYSGDVTEYVKTNQDKFPLAYTIPSKLYILGDNNTSLESSIFNVQSDKARELAEINGKWALIIIEERIPSNVEPLSAIKDKIVKTVKMKKQREIMNEWIEGLRTKARIRINKKTLQKLQ